MELIKLDIVKTKGIETRTPANLKPLVIRKRELIKCLDALTVDFLKIIYKYFFGRTTAIKKSDLCEVISEALTFSSVEQFEVWFFSLPELIQKILHEAVFTDYVPIPYLEKKLGVPIAVYENKYWKSEWKFLPAQNIDFLPIGASYGCPVTVLPVFLRSVLAVWLSPPPPFHFSGCRIQDQSEYWNNSLAISDTYPLLCDALQNILEEINPLDYEKILRKGFGKTRIKELRSSTGFLPFNIEGEFFPDSVDLAARFILCLYNFNPQRPSDGHEGIRKLVQDFFSSETLYPKRYDAPDRAYLEYTICIEHLSKSSAYSLRDNTKLPASRNVFYNILMQLARDGSWFDADNLAQHIRITGKDFSFCASYLESNLRIRADSFDIDGQIFLPGYSDFHPDKVMRYPLLVRPLFKAYCYYFAVLGILEIVQVQPPLARSYNNKKYPVSPYDSIKAIRITELGRWCLGLTDKLPPKPVHEYHAIADSELLLVTVQGSSLERQVYLDKIGQRLGENRWRVNPASFIAGCANIRQINDRIERFKALIDPNPAPHWEQLFKKVLDRVGLFSKNRSDMLVYDLPENPEITEELLSDPELKRIMRRVEGRMLAIAAKDQKKFFALLNEHGIAPLAAAPL
ncbi:MAG: hypothetical protein FWH41_09365 [Treponema sp.]|nr:hypothetical protein [Treponema sp.]